MCFSVDGRFIICYIPPYPINTKIKQVMSVNVAIHVENDMKGPFDTFTEFVKQQRPQNLINLMRCKDSHQKSFLVKPRNHVALSRFLLLLV